MKFIIIIVIFITLLASDILVFDKEKLNDFLVKNENQPT